MRLRSEGLTWQEVDGELIILDLESSKYLTANETGSVLLRLLTQERSRDELVEALVERYGVSVAEAGDDVDSYTEALRARGLLA